MGDGTIVRSWDDVRAATKRALRRKANHRRVQALEYQLEQKDTEIQRLKDALSDEMDKRAIMVYYGKGVLEPVSSPPSGCKSGWNADWGRAIRAIRKLAKKRRPTLDQDPLETFRLTVGRETPSFDRLEPPWRIRRDGD